MGTKLFAAASYNGAKILLKEPHSDFTVFFGFYLYFFSELSVCEISCVKQESNKTSKISEPFLHPYEEIEQQIQRERKAIRSIGKAEKSCHNGLIYFLKSYFYFQTPLLSYLIFYKLIFIFFQPQNPFPLPFDLIVLGKLAHVAHTRLTLTKRFTNLKVNQTCNLFLHISYEFESVLHNFLGSEGLQRTHIDALNPFSSKLMILTLGGGF